MQKFTLSHSSYGKYVTCPKSFKFHYVDKLRPTLTPSHLIFGCAVDKALNVLVDGNGEPCLVLKHELGRLLTGDIEFFRADYDGELLEAEAKRLLAVACTEVAGVEIKDVDSLAFTLLNRPVATLSVKQRQVLAMLCAASLNAKAGLMIEAYRKQVLPKLNVTTSQESVRWTDEHGNDFIGILDLKGDLGYGVMPIDNKTASRPYEQDAVGKSTQLAIYSSVTGHTKAAFIVMDKTIRKNRIKVCSLCGHDGTGGRHKTCDNTIEFINDADSKHDWKRCNGAWTETIQPEANIQIIVGDVSPQLQAMAREALSETAQVIKSGYFPRNLNACDNQYGRPCPYRNYCWNGDATGLQVDPTKDKGNVK